MAVQLHTCATSRAFLPGADVKYQQLTRGHKIPGAFLDTTRKAGPITLYCAVLCCAVLSFQPTWPRRAFHMLCSDSNDHRQTTRCCMMSNQCLFMPSFLLLAQGPDLPNDHGMSFYPMASTILGDRTLSSLAITRLVITESNIDDGGLASLVLGLRMCPYLHVRALLALAQTFPVGGL